MRVCGQFVHRWSRGTFPWDPLGAARPSGFLNNLSRKQIDAQRPASCGLQSHETPCADSWGASQRPALGQKQSESPKRLLGVMSSSNCSEGNIKDQGWVSPQGHRRERGFHKFRSCEEETMEPYKSHMLGANSKGCSLPPPPLDTRCRCLFSRTFQTGVREEGLHLQTTAQPALALLFGGQ